MMSHLSRFIIRMPCSHYKWNHSDNIKCSLRNGELEEWVAERRENFPEEVAFILRPEG